MSLACALAVLLVAPAADQPAPANTEVATDIPSDPATDVSTDIAADAPAERKTERVRQAGLLLAARRYAEAAREYEALHQEFSDTALLLAAARSRLAAGHNAHAVAYLSQLVASGQLTAADTQVAYGELQAAQRQVTPVTVRVQLPLALAAESPRLTAQYVPQYGADPRPPLEFPLPPGAGAVRALILQLDPGAWRLQIAGPTLAPVDVLIDVLVQPGAPVQLDLRQPSDAGGLPRPQRQRLAGVVTGIGGALVGVGVGLTVRGQVGQVQPTLARPPERCPEPLACREALASAMSGRSVGAGLLGAGTGAMLSGLTALIGGARQRRAAWIFELALGSVGVVGGGLAVALSARAFDRENVTGDRPWADPDYVDTIRRRGQQHTIAAAGLGLASGLVFGSVTGLAYTRVYRHRTRYSSLRPGLGLGGRGLAVTLSGHF